MFCDFWPISLDSFTEGQTPFGIGTKKSWKRKYTTVTDPG